MALSSKIYKVELVISDMDRHYYATHPLTLALHPSETNQRLMLRILAFCLFAEENLSFGKGLSADNEPDLWDISLSSTINTWIDLGLPTSKRIRQACGKAKRVKIITYGERAFGPWWSKNSAELGRCKNLEIFKINDESLENLEKICNKNMQINCTIDDGVVNIGDDSLAFDMALEKVFWRQC